MFYGKPVNTKQFLFNVAAESGQMVVEIILTITGRNTIVSCTKLFRTGINKLIE